MGNPAFLEVAFPIPLNKTFHYALNDFPVSPSLIGARVLAPFGKKQLVGYAVGYTEVKPVFPTKSIAAWIDPETLLDPSLVELAHWLSKRYLCSVGEALASILPGHLVAPKRERAASPGRRTLTEEPFTPPGKAVEIQLSAEQKMVLAKFSDAVQAKRYEPFLLRGITDSGKTELYVRTMDQVLAQGRQALFLLPEIALTPPFIERFHARYGADRVGVWHSVLSERERYETWQRVRSGEIHVLLGARSAVFAPFPHLGVLVLDEEHEATYKQEDRPRYHAREVARWRAERAKAVLILGSATPSLESYTRAKEGVYTLVELTSRVEMRQLPPVTLIDRRPPATPSPSPIRVPFSIFSEPLKLAMEQRLARREQILLFINRRGFNPFMRCSKCGWVARCPRCSLALGIHVQAKEPKQFMLCHGCGHTEKVPVECGQCGSVRIRSFGIGTQRVEEEVKKIFPFIKAARLDRDISQFRKQYESIYRAFARRELDVLVGTQLIAKGFDFPAVTLVGVVDADVSLHLPDFRSAERTFQLITQVAGRTGRGEKPGRVLVQTHHPEHYALQAAKDHDFLRFYKEEMPHREALSYPPFCDLVALLIRAPKESVAQAAAEELADKLLKLGPGVDVLGPNPAPYSRLRGQCRYQIVLKGTRQTLQPYLEFLRNTRLHKAFLTVDVDPVDLL